jgi:serine/threonine-protein kinase PknK
MPPELTVRARGECSYRLEGEVGSGASGSVWRSAAADGTRVALKLGRGPAERGRFASEAMRLLLAGSSSLPALLDAGAVSASAAARLGVPAGTPYLALEWLAGSALDPVEIPEELRNEWALVVAQDVARALADLHAAGLAHGDVKPKNILFEPEQRRARLVDLGLSEAVSERRVQGATPRYLAPEARLAEADSDAGARDLWALGLTLAEIADASVAGAPHPAERAQQIQFEPRLEALIRPLLRSAGGARPGADWVFRRAALALGSEDSVSVRQERASAALRRAYLSTRRPVLERAARGDVLDLRVTGLGERWLRETVALLGQVAELRGVSLSAERQRVVVADLSALERERFLLKLLGPSDPRLAPIVSDADAELLERLQRSIEEQSPRHVAGLVFGGRAHDPGLDGQDPVALAVALADGVPGPDLLSLCERFVLAHPDARALGLALARALRLQEQLGRALGVLDRIGGAEAAAEAAEIARRAGDDTEALRRLAKLEPELGAAPPKVRARARGTHARIELKRGDAAAALARLADAPAHAAALEVRAMILFQAGDHRGAEHCLIEAQRDTDKPEELARLEFLCGRVAHARQQYEAALRSFARAADYAVRAGAVLEEATYLSGVAAAATELGQLSQALGAADRALLLYEYLGRAEHAARAALSRAGVFLVAGAREEAVEAADEALRFARVVGDRLCQGYAHLTLGEAQLDTPLVAVEHTERARQLIGIDSADDLRVKALELELKRPVDWLLADARAASPNTSAEIRLGWWGARARHALGAGPSLRPTEILHQLSLLVSAHAGVGVRGPAFAAGSNLAVALADGELARRFSRLAGEAAAALRRAAPRQLVQSLGLRAWTLGHDAVGALSVAPEQVRDVDTLVRALTLQGSLRSLLNQVLDALVLWTGVERGLLLLTVLGGRLVPRAARNLGRRDLNPAQRELSYSLAERAIASREPVVAVDAIGELPDHHESVHALKLRSLLAIPLFFKGTPLGVVYLDDRVRIGAFGPQELAWVRLVASIAAVAIGDARDQLELRRAVRRAQRAELRLSAALRESQTKLDVAEQQLSQQSPERTRARYGHIVGESLALRELLTLIDRVTGVDIPVLVLGESGTGKELVARALHENGSRARAAFVTENCAAIPETLLESTLFGHMRGAFTGAVKNHAGLFSVAHQGTLFLDEIGEMNLGMQAKLLRVLETGEVRPLGSEKNQHVDVRVIAATQRNLESMVREGTFREDLYYRLNVVSITVPALRQRQTDVPLLMKHFLAKYAEGPVPTLSDAAAAHLTAYAWPGNVRELENEARRALVMAGAARGSTRPGASDAAPLIITPDHLSTRVQGKLDAVPAADDLNVRARVDRLEIDLVRTALDKTAGNQTRAAELLGLSRFGLQKMMKRLHIGKPQG